MPDLPSVFRANAEGRSWLPDRTHDAARGWRAHIGRAVRGDLVRAAVPELAPGVTALDAAGREHAAHLATDVTPTEHALVAPRWLFVYGTLMHGEGLHEHLVERGLANATRRATVAGHLHDFDAWPGLVPDPSTTDRVTGELYPLDEPTRGSVLVALDEVEDFFGYGNSDSCFRRLPLETIDERGAIALAWCYRVIEVGDAPRIASGDWRLHQRG